MFGSEVVIKMTIKQINWGTSCKSELISKKDIDEGFKDLLLEEYQIEYDELREVVKEDDS